MNTTSRLYSEREAAAILQVHPDTLRQWRYASAGPPWLDLAPHRKRPVVRYRASDLDAWIAEKADAARS